MRIGSRMTCPMYIGNPKGLGVLHVCRNPLYTPLESGFTGKSLTIPDFVRGTLFRNVCREFVTTKKVGHFAKNAFLREITTGP